MELPPTPEEVMSTFSVDVFQATVGAISYPTNPAIITNLTALCWNRFRRRAIGDWDYVYWQTSFNDKVMRAWSWYQLIATQLTNASILDTSDLNDTHTDTPAHSITTTVNSQEENLPDIQEGTTQYLSNRGNITTSTNNSGSITSVDKSINGMAIEKYNKLLDELKLANERFLDELEICFFNRW